MFGWFSALAARASLSKRRRRCSSALAHAPRTDRGENLVRTQHRSTRQRHLGLSSRSEPLPLRG